jgi:dUTPase
VYPDYHIIPRGSGHKVIEATKALRGNQNIHHLNVCGLIDSDYKEEEERQSLLQHGIFTISVAEIENLFCVEPVL